MDVPKAFQEQWWHGIFRDEWKDAGWLDGGCGMQDPTAEYKCTECPDKWQYRILTQIKTQMKFLQAE